MPPSRHVALVLDFVCVQSYQAFTRLVRAADRHRAEGGAVDITFLPFQLRPEAGREGEPLFELHKRERGEATARAIAADTTHGAEDGLTLDLRSAVFVNTFDAHRLLAHAAAQGRGERMAERLFRAYYADGLHLADPATLTRLATEADVDTDGLTDERGADRLRADLRHVRELGITTPPAFRFGDGDLIEGERSQEELLAALRAERGDVLPAV
ncbi:DsbA family protein [Streptomyces sp. NPDC003077]|uniref:DsbA family oxidoreductase n=1 Tax=Streptomyces sp. NPDC003077 TaxID=3154443 RepID=UPI0033B7B02E